MKKNHKYDIRLRNGRPQYSRKKTGQTLTISWEKPMQEIVDAYSHLTKDTLIYCLS